MLALRTPRQKRTQMTLLSELMLEMQWAFNKHFDKLRRDKDDCADKMEEKNIRMREILLELGSAEVVPPPKRHPFERPETVFELDGDLTTTPYVSTAAAAAVAAAAAERQRREEEARGCNVGARALHDMMHGTLEAAPAAAAAAMTRPAFLDSVDAAEWTDEQRRKADEYMAQLKEREEERALRRKALELELKKLRTEAAEISRAFDDRVAELAEMRLHVQRAVGAQALSVARLAMGIVEREDDDVSMEKLEKALGAALGKRALARTRLEAFRKHVDAAREAIDAAQAEDRALERNFKKEIQEAASNPMDMADMMAQLVQLYRLRDRGGCDGGVGQGSGMRASGMGNSSARTSYRKGSVRASSGMRDSSANRESSAAGGGGGAM
ncbi:unnamed protein product, partial [Phaeothamnion confervicola]